MLSEDHEEPYEKEEAKNIMREWFFRLYENPKKSCPYELGKDNYVYIWGILFKIPIRYHLA